MKNIQEAGFIKEMIKATQDMWLKGWDERNGGNVSYRLEPREVQLLPNAGKGTDTCEKTNLATAVPELANEAFLVTGSGKYFRNVILDPTANLGILRIAADGKSYEKLWGFSNSAVPTSELAAHLLSHAVRLKASGGKGQGNHSHALDESHRPYLSLRTERESVYARAVGNEHGVPRRLSGRRRRIAMDGSRNRRDRAGDRRPHEGPPSRAMAPTTGCSEAAARWTRHSGLSTLRKKPRKFSSR